MLRRFWGLFPVCCRSMLPASCACIVALSLASTAGAVDAPWTPSTWADVDTLEILTIGPEEGEHWSKLWLVVLDDQLYVRLGSKATERIQRNTSAPYVAVKISGQRFDRVRAERAPDLRQRVAEAMAKKYWSDLVIRWLPHPLILRLIPETTTTEPAGPQASWSPQRSMQTGR